MKSFSCSSSKKLNKSFLQKTNFHPCSYNTYSYNKLKLKLNDIELNSKKSGNKFYYKNPQFLNDSNIQKQINILLTNVNNLRKSQKLPKLIFDENKKINEIENIKMNYIQTSENEFPKINLRSRSKKIYDSVKNANHFNKSVDYTYKSIFPSEVLFK